MNRYEQRLLQEWQQHGKIVISVDFDDTIYPWKWRHPEDMESLQRLIDLLKVARETGAYIVIFTCSAPDRHEEIQKYCDSIKLPIDAININPINLPYGNHGKVYANIYLDDRAGLNEAISMLDKVMYIIRGEKAAKLTNGEIPYTT